MRAEINGITDATKRDYYFRYYIPDDMYVGTFTFSSFQTQAGVDYNYAVYVRLICFETRDNFEEIGVTPTGNYTTLFAGWVRTNSANEKVTIPINYVIDSPNVPTFYLIISNINGYPITFRSHIFYYFRAYAAIGNYKKDEHIPLGTAFWTITKSVATIDAMLAITPANGEYIDLGAYTFSHTNGAAKDVRLVYDFYGAGSPYVERYSANLAVSTPVDGYFAEYGNNYRLFYPNSLLFYVDDLAATNIMSLSITFSPSHASPLTYKAYLGADTDYALAEGNFKIY